MNCFYEDGHDCEVFAVMSVFIAKSLESLTAYIPAIFATTEQLSSVVAKIAGICLPSTQHLSLRNRRQGLELLRRKAVVGKFIRAPLLDEVPYHCLPGNAVPHHDQDRVLSV